MYRCPGPAGRQSMEGFILGKGGSLADGCCGSCSPSGLANGCSHSQSCHQASKAQDHVQGAQIPCSIPLQHCAAQLGPIPGPLLCPSPAPTCPLPVPDDESAAELAAALAPFVLLHIPLHLHRLCWGLTSLWSQSCFQLVSTLKICLAVFTLVKSGTRTCQSQALRSAGQTAAVLPCQAMQCEQQERFPA